VQESPVLSLPKYQSAGSMGDRATQEDCGPVKGWEEREVAHRENNSWYYLKPTKRRWKRGGKQGLW